LSFHKQEFHETKRERKFYEGKKQKALRYLDHTIEQISYADKGMDKANREYFINKMKELKKRVNDI